MKNQNLFILVLLCLARSQEPWEIIYKTFQDKDSMDLEGWVVKNSYTENKVSNCAGYTLFGGYNQFSSKTIVYKHFSLPPHYKLKITSQFWKIDSWNDEYAYAIADNYVWSQMYSYSDGTQMCGRRSDLPDTTTQITIITNNYSKSLLFIMTSNLDVNDEESWGFRDFILSILRCPQGCIYCQDNDYNNCYYWIDFLSLWYQSIELDGWMKNDNTLPATGQCVDIVLVGGKSNLAPNDKLGKIIENLAPHYRIQVNVQFWKIGLWKNEQFSLEIDDQINKTDLGTQGIYSICGATELVKIFNIGVTLSHSKSQCKITMRTNLNTETTDASWGIRAFDIYLAKCFTGCDQCIGPLKTDCKVCSSGWIFYKDLCTHPPPMLFSQISITQNKDSQSDQRISMEIRLLEVDQQIITQGDFTLLFKNNQQILTVQVYVKCFPNKTIKSQFQFNNIENSHKYQFEKECKQNFNSVIYKVKYDLRTITEQELIFNTSDTKCLIYQVIKVAGESELIKILEILQDDV
ncbi:unnamed protein product (macronuclear) [Paramecium tetraurelia]|uniref:Uncharacterized protein n=1 Tax=Paramecium tetraurelia TaxID=5888 RepID=A0C7Z8_PARTE|nr:uncharacterized protein GSPATT00036046001 [Paramecium tetraurelia]CAK66915.1 unnamed protein product [Paramecium tetraurelia]|eukprot:XP_001434312.1 hypothetical protein (macronuclear) [Paramecium tetraurelia strain d4-2]